MPAQETDFIGISRSNTNYRATIKEAVRSVKNGAFLVNLGGTDQTGMTAAAYSKVEFDNEVRDEEGWFDSTTNYRYTPLIAGLYRIDISVSTNSGTDFETHNPVIRKNGANIGLAPYYGPNVLGGASTLNLAVGGLIEMNGSTDYIEGFCYVPTGRTYVLGGTSGTFMSGYLVSAD